MLEYNRGNQKKYFVTFIYPTLNGKEQRKEISIHKPNRTTNIPLQRYKIQRFMNRQNKERINKGVFKRSRK